MKKFYVAAFAFAALATTACNNTEEKVEETAGEKVEEVVAEELTYNLDAEATTLNWKGSWVKDGEVMKSHNGTVSVTDGMLTMKGDEFVNGKFAVDMTTIQNEDLGSDEEKAKLVGHLQAPSFFNTEAHPTTEVKVNSVSDDVMNITIMAVGEEFTKDITVNKTMSEDGSTMTAESSFSVDFGTALPYTNPEDTTEGKVSSEIAFDLKLVLKK